MKQEAAIGVLVAMGGSALLAGTQSEGTVALVLTMVGLTFFLFAFLSVLPFLKLPQPRLVYEKPTPPLVDEAEEEMKTVDLPKRGPERKAA